MRGQQTKRGDAKNAESRKVLLISLGETWRSLPLGVYSEMFSIRVDLWLKN